MWVFDPTARRQLSHPNQEKGKKLKYTESKILELLLVNQGKVVSKQTILHEVWGDRIVSASSITQSIAQIRLILGDNGKEQRYIKTVPKQGYMLSEGGIKFSQQNLTASEAKLGIKGSEHEKKVKQQAEKSSLKPVNRPSLNKLIQYTLAVFLSIGIISISYWLITIYLHSRSVSTKQWLNVEVAGISYYYESSPSGTKLFEAISDVYQSNISKIFLSKNPEQIYVSCIYKTAKFSETGTANLSFSNQYTTQQIKEAIREQCQ
ncbi:winged helix-turn-helix domain-containing protein [Vibrio aestuarianus]|uniref:winged helix-turn-helix domain-containing protein n=1 Tax=Vibrio aestuarianus TaxID=28171 RepID=UPI00237CF5AB|nr:transcriptional regulator [Vibrio aestuarianus]MDE1211835.1 transcriptional regulator [Vibrio aestuarianus]MDE1254955.1 transcriptional regulator [Vibrio aestuarianus]MDE1319758.1 transcriptional regulator [Vibrio aestuarianus]